MVTFGTNQLSGARVQAILDNGGWPASDRAVDTGLTTVSGSQDVSGSLLSQLQDVAAAELGQVFISVNGSVVFRERYSELLSAASGTSAATFGPLSSSTCPYQDLTFSYADDQLKNQIAVSRISGTTRSTVQDDESIALYGVRTLDLSDLLVVTDDAARQIAELYLTVYGNPEYFPEEMRLVPESKPSSLYPQVLGRELRDRITVTFTAPGGVSRTVDCFVDGITHSVTPGGWVTTFSLTSTSTYDTFFILDSATSGLLDTSVLGA